MSSQLPFIIITGLCVALNLGPMYWQIKQGNSGPICFGLWVLAANLRDLVNYLTWFSDAVNRAPIWCDISVKLQIGTEVGRLASIMCIARFLASVVSPRATAMTRRDKYQRAVFDYFMGLGVPLMVMAGHIIYQPNRFLLSRGTGCVITVVMSWPMLVLWLIWPPVFAIIGVLYSAYTMYRLTKHRRDFGRSVAGSHSALTTARFVRLAGLSFTYLLIGLPLSIHTTLTTLKTAGQYYDYSWTYLHSTWKVEPVQYQYGSTVAGINTWSDVIAAGIFFVVFGFGTEAMAVYSTIATFFKLQITWSKIIKSLKSLTVKGDVGEARKFPFDTRAKTSAIVMDRYVDLNVDRGQMQNDKEPLKEGVRIVVERQEDFCVNYCV